MNTDEKWEEGYEVWLNEPHAPADERCWQFQAMNGRLLVRAWNDAHTAYTETVIDRTGCNLKVPA